MHPNWPAPVYPALAIAAAKASGDVSGNINLRRLRLWVTPVGIGLSSLLLLDLATPMGENVPWASPTDTFIGWQRLTVELEDRRQRSGAAWIATTDYGLTGEIAFYARMRITSDRLSIGSAMSSKSPMRRLLESLPCSW